MPLGIKRLQWNALPFTLSWNRSANAHSSDADTMHKLSGERHVYTLRKPARAGEVIYLPGRATACRNLVAASV